MELWTKPVNSERELQRVLDQSKHDGWILQKAILYLKREVPDEPTSPPADPTIQECPECHARVKGNLSTHLEMDHGHAIDPDAAQGTNPAYRILPPAKPL